MKNWKRKNNKIMLPFFKLPIKELIVKYPVAYSHDLAVKTRAVMRQSRVRAMPVFEDKKLIGIITRSDIVKITSTKSRITVKELLWKPLISIDANTNIISAAKILVDSHIKQAPVLENGKYIGMLLDTEILKMLRLNFEPKRKTVLEVMNVHPQSISPKDSIDKVLFAFEKHTSFPVIDSRKLVGFLTSKEMIESGRARLSKSKFSKSMRKPALVSSVMIKVPDIEKYTLKTSTPIQEAVRKIINANMNMLPVFNHTGIVGIVTKRDLLKAYI